MSAKSLRKGSPQNNQAEAVLQAEEHDRLRLSRRMHDELGNVIGGLHLSLSLLSSSAYLHESLKKDLEEITRHMKAAVQSVREISAQLSPASLHKGGLEAALRELPSRFRQKGTVISVSYDYKEEIPMPEAGLWYKIVLDLLLNALQHAVAAEVAIQVKEENGLFSLVVRDNGQGFHPGRVQKSGIAAVEARAAFLGAVYTCHTAKGKGCSWTFNKKELQA